MHLRSLVALISIVAASSACSPADAQVKGTGTARTEARAVGRFSKLSAGGAIHLTITVGGATAVTVTADDNVVPLIRTRVQADRLIIDSADGYTSRTPIEVVVTTPRLTALGLSGATTAEARGLTGDRFALDLSGDSHATLTGTATAIAIAASGAAQLGSSQSSMVRRRKGSPVGTRCPALVARSSARSRPSPSCRTVALTVARRSAWSCPPGKRWEPRSMWQPWQLLAPGARRHSSSVSCMGALV